MLFKVILLPIFFTYSLCSFAKWSENTRLLIKETSEKSKVVGPAGYISLWGGMKRTWKNKDKAGEIVEVNTELVETKKVPVYFKAYSKKTALNFIFPGIFGQDDGNLTPSIISTLESLGGHVAVIPNFLSKKYIKSKPIYEDDVSSSDIKIATEIVKKIINKITTEKITHINLVAESLGTFVGSGVLAELSKNKIASELKINLTLMWAPLKLTKVLENFDNKLKKTKKTYDECHFWFRYPAVYYYFVFQEKPDRPSEEFVKCMDSYLYHGVFKKGIEKSIRAAFEAKEKKLSKVPQNFEEYFKTFNPKFYQMIKSNNPALNLSHWLKQRDQSRSSIRIISSIDDFLNKGIDWNQFLKESNLNSENLILMDWGAHCGGLAMNIWKEIFQKEIMGKWRN